MGINTAAHDPSVGLWGRHLPCAASAQGRRA